MIRVYEYGCLRPRAGEQEAIEQMRRRNRLWNALVEVENQNRQQAAELLSEPEEQQTIDELLQKLDDLRTSIKLKRQAARSKKVDIAEFKAEIELAKTALQERIAEAKVHRKERVSARKEQLAELNQRRIVEVKRVTHEAELYWCNYDDVLASYDTARQRFKTGLRFHGFRGEGKVSVRYQVGLPAGQAFGTDTRFRLREFTPEELAATGIRKPKARHEVSLRVGSIGRAPLWFQLPVVLHRPFPPDSMIRSVAIKREVVAGRARYKLLITVNDGIDVASKTGERMCALDLGWRLIPVEDETGLRVAYWADDLGRHGSLTLPASVLWEFERVRTLQSTIDLKFEQIKAYLRDKLEHKELVVSNDELREELSTLAQWRSPGRLFRWARKAQAFGLTDPELEAWSTKQKHLYAWAANLQDQVGKQRREIYRVFAQQLAQRYDKIILEEFDLRQVAQKPAPEQTEPATHSNRYRQIASISELRTTIQNTAAREGTVTVKKEAMYTTQRCHICGNREHWDAAVSVVHRCGECLSVWDQDYNAALNLLAIGADSPELAAEVQSA